MEAKDNNMTYNESTQSQTGRRCQISEHSWEVAMRRFQGPVSMTKGDEAVTANAERGVVVMLRRKRRKRLHSSV